MRGVFGLIVRGSLVAALCALAGCSGMNKISSIDGPLTPYAPAPTNATADASPAVTSPDSATPTPFRYDPSSVDRDMLDQEEKKPNWFERMGDSLAPKKMGTKFMTWIGQGPDEDIAKHLYAEGEVAFREKNFNVAAKRYKSAARRWPDSTLQEDALFMVAESNFQQDKYPKASDTYTKLLKKYENSRHLDLIVKRRFAIGRYWEQRSKDDPPSTFNFADRKLPFWDLTGNTVALYESIRMDDPTGPLADDATMATANTYFLKGRWEDAAYHYDLMRTEFPQSEFQPQAHLLGMQAKLQSYQGPHYDGRPLSEAKKLGTILQTQFASRMPNERENIQQTMRVIDAQLAERDWSLGEYYHNTSHFAASKYYYNEVVKQHPQSRFADLAKARIEEVKDKPPEPKNEIEWVASKFRRAPTAPAGTPAPTGAPPTAAPDQPFLAGPPYTPPYASPPGGPDPIARQPQDQR